MQGKKSRFPPGAESRPGLQCTNLYICIVPLKFMNFCGVFLGGREEIEKSATPTVGSKLSQLSRATPALLLDRAQTQTAPTPPAPPKKRFPVLSANLGDKATTRHTSVGLKCAKKCARQSVRERGKKKLVPVTLQREGPSCPPDYGPFGSGGK